MIELDMGGRYSIITTILVDPLPFTSTKHPSNKERWDHVKTTSPTDCILLMFNNIALVIAVAIFMPLASSSLAETGEKKRERTES